MRVFKTLTIDYRSGITAIPIILFLTIMLVVVYPGQSQSVEEQFKDASQHTAKESKKEDGELKIAKESFYKKMLGNVKRLVTFPKQSQPKEKQTKETSVSAQNDFEKNKQSEAEKISYKDQMAINPNQNNIYDILISVVKQQKLIESMNKELITQLSKKNEKITSLKYTEEVLWNQLEESEDKYWNTVTDKAYMEDALLAQIEESEDKYWNTVTDKAYMEDALLAQIEKSEDKYWNIVTNKAYMEDVLLAEIEESENRYWNTVAAKDVEYQQAKVLTDILDLKDYVIRTLEEKERILRAQLEDNKRKFQEALAARDAQYQKAVKNVSSSAEPVFGYSPPITGK